MKKSKNNAFHTLLLTKNKNNPKIEYTYSVI